MKILGTDPGTSRHLTVLKANSASALEGDLALLRKAIAVKGLSAASAIPLV